MGETIQVGTLTIHWLSDGDERLGTPAMFEVHVPPAARVPAPHSHDDWEEVVYCLEGELTWTVEGTDHLTKPGEFVSIARGDVHGFVNGGDVLAKGLCIVTPPVLTADYFREVGAVLAAAPADGPPPIAGVGEVMRRHRLTPVAPVAT